MDVALDKRVRPQFIILANFGKNSKGIKYRETYALDGPDGNEWVFKPQDSPAIGEKY